MDVLFKKRLQRASQQDLDKAFMLCCIEGKIERIDYLLTSEELSHHPNIYVDDCFGFKSACGNKDIQIIKYLIFEIGIEKTQIIDIFLTTSPTKFKEDVFNLFKLRDLNNKLINELNSEKINTKIVKV